MEDLAFDVTTCVKVAFDNGEIILNDQRNQRIIAEHIMEELSKQIRAKLTLSIWHRDRGQIYSLSPFFIS